MAEQRPPPKLTASYLENAALHYLERFASSTVNLRRVMMRKIDRSLAHWGGERDEASAMLAAALEKLAGLGYLDDTAYARAKAAGLHRRGKACRVIRAALAAKGVDSDDTDAALADLIEDTGTPDLTAAIALARRRRLGPFRLPEAREAHRVKDMAVLGRAGFDYDTARRVVNADDVDELEFPCG
jgi:regulatory protein